MDLFFTIGQNTWGIVPTTLRIPLFWFLIVLGVILIGLLLTKGRRRPVPPKTPPELYKMGGQKVFDYRARKHTEEIKHLRIMALLGSLLLSLALIRILGYVVYSETMQMVSQFGQSVTVPLGTTINSEGLDYTCSESKRGHTFTYQPNKSALAVEAGPYVTNKSSSITTFTPVWWGMQTKVTITKVIYTCEA